MASTPSNGQCSKDGHTSASSSDIAHAIPPLPRRTQVFERMLSKKKASNLKRNKEENEHPAHRTDKKSQPTKKAVQDLTKNQLFQVTSSPALCTSRSNNGYLTPTDPPTYEMSPRDDEFSISNTADIVIPREDSGITDDLPGGARNVNYNTPTPLSAAALLTTARTSAHYDLPYEDIDHYNRIYDDQHHPPHQQQSAVSPNVSETPPTYSLYGSNTWLGMSQETVLEDRDRCWILVSLLAILLVSLTALGICTYQLASPSPKSRQIPQDLKQTLADMEITVKELRTENEIIMEALLANTNNFTSLSEDKIDLVWSQMQNLSVIIESMSDKFGAQIANISNSPGLQGQPGMVNFSRCLNQSATKTAPASTTAITETWFLPSVSDIQMYFVTFGYCTYTGATDANLDRQLDNSTQRQRYRCKCWGQVSAIQQTTCTVTIWMCPHQV